MKRIVHWQVVLAVLLISVSALLYLLHYSIFHDAHHIFLYMIGDLAFLFIDVLLVTLILHRLLAFREKRTMLKKLNMVIGAFFSEAGIRLIRIFAGFDPAFAGLAGELIVTNAWTDREFLAMRGRLEKHIFSVDRTKGDLEELKRFLGEKRQFLLGLLENPNLLEHESFTNLLWAVFHLTEELSHRRECAGLPQADYEHLEGDIKRAYALLVGEWLMYMKHLKTDYPYLFSLAVRTNPFDASARAVVC